MTYELGKEYQHADGNRLVYRGNVAGVLHFSRVSKPVLELLPEDAAQQVSEVVVVPTKTK